MMGRGPGTIGRAVVVNESISQIWETRAKECRTLAESFQTKGAHDRMLKVPRSYQKMAEQAAQRELKALNHDEPGKP
jgi:hypothetical protein